MGIGDRRGDALTGLGGGDHRGLRCLEQLRHLPNFDGVVKTATD